MDYVKFIVSNQKEESISLKGDSYKFYLGVPGPTQ